MGNIHFLGYLPGLLHQFAQLRTMYVIWHRVNYRAKSASVVAGKGLEYFRFFALFEGVVCCFEDYGGVGCR